jgi:hypothetical protein
MSQSLGDDERQAEIGAVDVVSRQVQQLRPQVLHPQQMFDSRGELGPRPPTNATNEERQLRQRLQLAHQASSLITSEFRQT